MEIGQEDKTYVMNWLTGYGLSSKNASDWMNANQDKIDPDFVASITLNPDTFFHTQTGINPNEQFDAETAKEISSDRPCAGFSVHT